MNIKTDRSDNLSATAGQADAHIATVHIGLAETDQSLLFDLPEPSQAAVHCELATQAPQSK